MLDEREDGDVDPKEAHRAFNRQSLARRSAIVVAGPRRQLPARDRPLRRARHGRAAGAGAGAGRAAGRAARRARAGHRRRRPGARRRRLAGRDLQRPAAADDRRHRRKAADPAARQRRQRRAHRGHRHRVACPRANSSATSPARSAWSCAPARWSSATSSAAVPPRRPASRRGDEIVRIGKPADPPRPRPDRHRARAAPTSRCSSPSGADATELQMQVTPRGENEPVPARPAACASARSVRRCSSASRW